ncbi:hypothetical protein BDR05DRAFT_965239 [Suillus weaverae]|nr:hypothetical protein BDR05DRAFT_965239 [Suillus weaverae]
MACIEVRMLAFCVLPGSGCVGCASRRIDVYDELGPKLCTGDSGVMNDAVHDKYKSTTADQVLLKHLIKLRVKQSWCPHNWCSRYDVSEFDGVLCRY